jgi:hypothetical protein
MTGYYSSAGCYSQPGGFQSWDDDWDPEKRMTGYDSSA